MNVFSGARRVALVVSGLWVLGACLANINSSPFVVLTYEVSSFGAQPALKDEMSSDRFDAIEFVYKVFDSEGHEANVSLYFKAAKSSDGRMLVPYAVTDDSSGIWMGD